MNKTVDLDIPRTAAERFAKEADGIHGLIGRMNAKASDGRYYALEDADREKAIALSQKHVASYDRIIKQISN